MHEGRNPRFGKFELVNVAKVDGQWHYTFRCSAGEVFSVVRPEMSKEMEREVREMVPEIPGEARLLPAQEQREVKQGVCA